MTKTFSLSTLALAATLALPVAAQTTLKFSHTDQQAGARQAAANIFAKKVEELTQGRYKVLGGDRSRPVLPPAELFLSAEQFFSAAGAWPRQSAQDLAPARAAPEVPVERRAADPLHRLKALITQGGHRIALLAESGVGAVLDELDRELVGLAPVKTRLREIASLLVVDKARAASGRDNILVCERGASFGYNNLVSDMRSLAVMRETGFRLMEPTQ